MFRERAARLRTLLEQGGDERARVSPPPGARPAMLLGSWGRNVERAARDSRLGPIGGGSDEIMKEILGRTMGL